MSFEDLAIELQNQCKQMSCQECSFYDGSGRCGIGSPCWWDLDELDEEGNNVARD